MKAPNPTRQSLLECGLDIVTRKGLRGLVVREVAASANVNLGSFVYHFGNRDQFANEIVERWYAPKLAQLRLTAANEAHHSALQRLHATLSQLIGIISDNAEFISHLLADALAGEQPAIRFLQALPDRHPKILLELVKQAQQEGILISAPPLELLVFIVAATGLPMLIGRGVVDDLDWLPEDASRFKQLICDPETAQRSLQWALTGISSQRISI